MKAVAVTYGKAVGAWMRTSARDTSSSLSRTKWSAGPLSQMRRNPSGAWKYRPQSKLVYLLSCNYVNNGALIIVEYQQQCHHLSLLPVCFVGSSLAFPLVPGGYIASKPPFYRSLSPQLRAVSLVVGTDHAILLTASGVVYTWGSGR